MKGDVVFEHVNFGYTAEKTVLHDISIHTKPGQKIALVGSTGSGKTTITMMMISKKICARRTKSLGASTVLII